MAVLTNTVFLEVVEVPIAPSGWEVQVVSYLDYNTPIATVPHFSALTIGPELSAAGTGTVTMDLDDVLFQHNLSDGSPASLLLDKENIWIAYQDGLYRFAWFGETVVEAVAQVDGSRTVTVSGPGIGSCLNRAVAMPSDYPANQDSTVIDLVNGINNPTHFPAQPVFKIFRTLLAEAQRRGTISFVTTSFSDTADSGGVLWADTNWTDYQFTFGVSGIYNPEPGKNYLDILSGFTGQDPTVATTSPVVVDWLMQPGFLLDVRQTFGSHLEDTVIFHQSGAAKEAQRTRARDGVRNLTVIQDDIGDYSISSDAVSIADFGQREALIKPGLPAVESRAVRATVANLSNRLTKDEVSSWTVAVDTAYVGRRPFYDYGVGDWIGIERDSGDIEAFRVLVIAVSVDDAGQDTCELTLETRLAFLEKQIQKQITKIEYTLSGGVPNVPGAAGAQGDVGAPGIPGTEALPFTLADLSSGLKDLGYPTPGSIGTGTGGGIKVFIQLADPSLDSSKGVSPGDIWIQTDA